MFTIIKETSLFNRQRTYRKPQPSKMQSCWAQSQGIDISINNSRNLGLRELLEERQDREAVPARGLGSLLWHCVSWECQKLDLLMSHKQDYKNNYEKKRPWNLKDNREEYMGGFEGRKGRGKWCNLKINMCDKPNPAPVTWCLWQAEVSPTHRRSLSQTSNPVMRLAKSMPLYARTDQQEGISQWLRGLTGILLFKMR